MKGYYAIYNHKRNAWWTAGSWWSSDTSFETHNIATKYELKRGWSIDGDPQLDLEKSNFKNVVCWNEAVANNPYNIFIFETLKEAEDYLLSGAIYKETNEFFTIRKIYF